MGWVATVDLIQQVARRNVFGMAKIPPELEVKPDGLFPHDGAWVLVYLDVLDVVRAVSDLFAARSAAESGRERLRDQFVDTCDNLKVPLNAGKRLVRALGGPVLGGEIDGVRGLFSHNRGKGLELFARYVAFLGEEHWTGQGLQQITGYFSFGFRRPLFSVLAETYAEATAYPPLLPFTPSNAAVLEILLSALLIPLAFTDLRASISRTISTSDASERARAAAEATAFRAECHPRVQELAAAHAAEMRWPRISRAIAGVRLSQELVHRAHGIVRSPFARHLVPPRTLWSARGGSFQGLVWPSSCRRQALDGRGLFNSLGFGFIPSVPPRLLTMTFHPQVPCFRRRFPWKPGRLLGSSGTARRPGSPTSSMLSCGGSPRALGPFQSGHSRCRPNFRGLNFSCARSFEQRHALGSNPPVKGEILAMARLMRTSGVNRDALYHVTDDGEGRHDVIFLHTSKRVATELSAVTSEKDAGSRAFLLTRSSRARLPAVQSCWAPWLSKQMDLHGTPPACACPSGGDPTHHRHA